MAFDEHLRQRIAAILDLRGVDFVEKRMFGGVAFMIHDKMSVGITGDDLMLRVIPERFDEVLARENVREMDFTGRPMKGFVFISPAGYSADNELEEWVNLAEEFGRLGKVKSRPAKR